MPNRAIESERGSEREQVSKWPSNWTDKWVSCPQLPEHWGRALAVEGTSLGSPISSSLTSCLGPGEVLPGPGLPQDEGRGHLVPTQRGHLDTNCRTRQGAGWHLSLLCSHGAVASPSLRWELGVNSCLSRGSSVLFNEQSEGLTVGFSCM